MSCLVSCIRLYRHTQSHSDTHPIDRLIQTRSHPLSLTQVCSTSHLTQSHSVLIQAHPTFLRLAQIWPISLKLIRTHVTSDSDSCNFHTDLVSLCSSTQNHTNPPNFIHPHSDLIKIIQIHLGALSHTRIHSDSLSLTPDSLCLPQTQSDCLRFSQICSD